MKGQAWQWRLITGAVVLGALCFGVPVAAASPEAVPEAQSNRWYAEYFSNRDLAGGPALTRYEDKIHFEWGKGSPGANIPTDDFSARLTRDEWFENGTYRFTYRADDGIRIWVGGTLVVDDWRESSAAWKSADHVMTRGTYRVRVEYFEHVGAAVLQAGWERIEGGSGWRAEYFDNRKLAGTPSLVRYDPAVDFDWGLGSPDPAIPVDDFSVRWTHTLGFTPGTYRFHASCDDGVRVFVDGQHILDAWHDKDSADTATGDIHLSAGQHTVVVEYYERTGKANAHVWWNLLATFGGWEGRYYDNAELRGGPALIRDDAAISFDWGEGAPADWMPADDFSVAWTRQVTFTPGYYRFNVRADDGVRVWLDGGILMDYWKPQDYAWHYVDGTYLTGVHTVKVEYFDRTGSARIRFWWEPSTTAPSPDGGGAPVVPVPASSPPGPWIGEYLDNETLAGLPVLVRSDGAIDFDWGWKAPAAGVRDDNFSVRWSGTFSFEAGRYRFTTTTDDGVRLYVDGSRIIDAWQPMRGSRYGYVTLAGGDHAVRVEYFERTQAAMARVTWQKVGAAAVPAAPVQPAASCSGGPVRLDAWPVGTTCTEGGWKATIFVQGYGGDCQYTYAWQGQAQGGSTPGSTTFEVKSASRGIAIVGEATVASAGQTAKVKLHVHPPDCGQ
jgi:hypothetical protein